MGIKTLFSGYHQNWARVFKEVRRWGIHYITESPHKKTNKKNKAGVISLFSLSVRSTHIVSVCFARIDMIVGPPPPSTPRHKKSTEGPRLGQ